MSLAPIGHIEVDDRNVAHIAGSRTKVTQIVLDSRARGWSPEEIKAQYPHLTLADIHAALAFYYDHQMEIDAQIEKDRKAYEEIRAAAGQSSVAQRLRAEGKLA
jgi:uncharacterized protein (DUF433 family)